MEDDTHLRQQNQSDIQFHDQDIGIPRILCIIDIKYHDHHPEWILLGCQEGCVGGSRNKKMPINERMCIRTYRMTVVPVLPLLAICMNDDEEEDDRITHSGCTFCAELNHHQSILPDRNEDHATHLIDSYGDQERMNYGGDDGEKEGLRNCGRSGCWSFWEWTLFIHCSLTMNPISFCSMLLLLIITYY